MKKLWHYFVNQFQVSTKRNYKKAFKLSRRHDMLQKNVWTIIRLMTNMKEFLFENL